MIPLSVLLNLEKLFITCNSLLTSLLYLPALANKKVKKNSIIFGILTNNEKKSGITEDSFEKLKIRLNDTSYQKNGIAAYFIRKLKVYRNDYDYPALQNIKSINLEKCKLGAYDFGIESMISLKKLKIGELEIQKFIRFSSVEHLRNLTSFQIVLLMDNTSSQKFEEKFEKFLDRKKELAFVNFAVSFIDSDNRVIFLDTILKCFEKHRSIEMVNELPIRAFFNKTPSYLFIKESHQQRPHLELFLNTTASLLTRFSLDLSKISSVLIKKKHRLPQFHALSPALCSLPFPFISHLHSLLHTLTTPCKLCPFP